MQARYNKEADVRKARDACEHMSIRGQEPNFELQQEAAQPIQEDETKESDPEFTERGFDLREGFLHACAVNHHQFDQLRLVKHSSAMVSGDNVMRCTHA